MTFLEKSSTKKLCIDLCSGLGGFSQAFRDDPAWEVITVDINPKFKPTIVADVCNLPLFAFGCKPSRKSRS